MWRVNVFFFFLLKSNMIILGRLLLLPFPRAPPVVCRDRDPVARYDDLQLYKTYRFDAEGIAFLTGLLHDDLVDDEVQDQRGRPVPTRTCILATLHYLAGHERQLSIAHELRISQSTVSRAVAAVTRALSRHANEFIRYPTEAADIARVSEDFLQYCGIGGVTGAIDCTHVQVRKPPVDAHNYFNRKGKMTLNIQATCSLSGVVTSLVAKWPGCTHDAFILRNCGLWTHFETRRRVGILLGDSGYPCREWLLTPHTYPPRGRRQKDFNKCHCKGRVIIEQVFGRVKRRFRILQGPIATKHRIIPHVITACFVLHNIILRHGIRQRVYGAAYVNAQPYGCD
eukprot:GHVU01181954.1.p1 GENE.GHVU01181954.1~~GHVU01181954.1.p1  ORF type:complete len:340 (-),score=9.86 GHVU01181954.1:60-1079(-)